MKKLLSILSLLCLTLSGFAQTTEQVPFYIREVGLSTNLYRVTATRNLSVYPYTKQGNIDFRNAVTLGQIERVTDDGCIIPVGQRAPMKKPTCGTTGTGTGPQWANSWYDYNGTLFSVRATGDDMLLKFERSDGQPLALKNPDGIDIDNLTFYEHATLAGNVYQWQVNFPSAPSLKLTYKRKSDGVTFAKTFTPAVGANNTNLFMAGTSTGGSNCDLQLAVNSPSVGCGATTTLTATASGTAASGLLYSWTGPDNYTNSGASIAITAAQSNGSYPYTVTASKSGCSASAISTVTVSGCASQTVAGTFSFQVPTQATNWDGFDSRMLGNVPPHGAIQVGNYFKQENDRYILYVNEGHGGLATIYDKATGRWLTNRPDQGRGDGYSSYSGPATYDDDAPHWHTGYNPLKNGDSGGNGTPISFKAKITIGGIEYLYTRSDEMISWSHVDLRKIKMKYEQWSALTVKDGTDIVDIHTRLTHNRDDLTDYGPYLNEWALMMINGRRNVYFYNGDRPYTNDDVRATDGFEKIVKNSQNQDVWITPGKPMPVSEPWIGVDIGNGRMIAHYNKLLYYPSFNLMDGPEAGDSDGGKTGMYTSGHIMDHLDPKRTWTFDDTWIMGTLGQVRAFVYAQPRAEKPNYVFNQANGRAGWNAWDNVSGPQMPFTSNTGWGVTFDGKTDNGVTSADNCKLRSPYTAFKASDCPTLYVKGRLSSTSNTAWKINYTYVGQEVDGFENLNVDGTLVYSPNQASIRVPKGVRPPDQAQPFTMQPDNVERVYAIPMNWNGNNYIHQIEIQQNAQGTQGGAKLNLISIGCINPN